MTSIAKLIPDDSSLSSKIEKSSKKKIECDCGCDSRVEINKLMLLDCGHGIK